MQMEAFIEKVTHCCFPELLRVPVLLELQKPGNYRGQIPPLTRICIRSILKREIRKGSIGDILLKLLFHEKLDIVYTSEQKIDDDDIFNYQLNFDTVLRKQNHTQICTNPELMQRVFQQNLDNKKVELVCIHLMETQCKVRIGGHVVMISPLYTTKWPLVFIRIAFEKRIRTIQIELTIGSLGDQFARVYLQNFIDSIGLIAPGHKSWDSCEGSIYYSNSCAINRFEPVLAHKFVIDPTKALEHPDSCRMYLLSS